MKAKNIFETGKRTWRSEIWGFGYGLKLGIGTLKLTASTGVFVRKVCALKRLLVVRREHRALFLVSRQVSTTPPLTFSIWTSKIHLAEVPSLKSNSPCMSKLPLRSYPYPSWYTMQVLTGRSHNKQENLLMFHVKLLISCTLETK